MTPEHLLAYLGERFPDWTPTTAEGEEWESWFHGKNPSCVQTAISMLFQSTRYKTPKIVQLHPLYREVYGEVPKRRRSQWADFTPEQHREVDRDNADIVRYLCDTPDERLKAAAAQVRGYGFKGIGDDPTRWAAFFCGMVHAKAMQVTA